MADTTSTTDANTISRARRDRSGARPTASPPGPPGTRAALARALVEGVEELIAVLDDGGRFVLASSSWAAATGHQPAPGDAVADHVHADDREIFRLALGRIADGAALATSVQLRIASDSGVERLVRARLVDHRATPGIGGTLLIAAPRIWPTDESLPDDDPVGSPARRSLVRILDRVQRHAAATGKRVIVALVEFDAIGEIDEVLGFAGGDRLLSTVSARLRDRLGACAAVGRTGAGGLAIVRWAVPPADLDDAIAELRATVTEETSRTVTIDGRPFVPRGTVGVAVDGGQRNAEPLLRDAGLAMRAARRASRRWMVHEPQMSVDRTQEFELRRLVDQAIVKEQIEVAFQPILSSDAEKVIGVEALARFGDELRSVPVARLIAAAETSGSIVELGQLVLRSAVATVASWTDWPGYLAVNVSPYQLALPEFEAQLVDVVVESGLGFDRLVLEVTESAMVDDDRPIHLLERLRARGVRIAVDDFGTGHSSISRLHRLPIDIVKIDREFVGELPRPAAQQIISTIITLAGSIGAVLVAEGVERGDQLELLRRSGVDALQGYLLGRPAIGYDPTRPPASARDDGVDQHVDHDVCFNAAADLAEHVAAFVGTGLQLDEAVVCVTDPARADVLRSGLRARGVDVAAAAATGQLRIVAEDELPELGRLASAWSGLRMYDETVGAAWARGDVAEALELERSWDALAAEHGFALLRGYPASVLDGD